LEHAARHGRPGRPLLRAVGEGAADHDPATDLGRLLAACAAGDRQALRRLYEIEAPSLLGVALRILRRRDLAEDAVQDALLRVWRSAGRYDPALGSPRAWLYALLRNLCLNRLRDEREQPTDEATLGSLLEQPLDPAEVAGRLADGSALRRCLEGLEPRRRDSIVLAYAGGLMHGEIAGRLGVPLGTAKAWLRRALLQLRECLS
jgi:RNA polymerase sigma-70 factor (ECF subfamily)